MLIRKMFIRKNSVFIRKKYTYRFAIRQRENGYWDFKIFSRNGTLLWNSYRWTSRGALLKVIRNMTKIPMEIDPQYNGFRFIKLVGQRRETFMFAAIEVSRFKNRTGVARMLKKLQDALQAGSHIIEDFKK